MEISGIKEANEEYRVSAWKSHSSLRQQGKPYYVPEREELLKRSDPHYSDKPKEFFRPQRYIEAAFPGTDSDHAEGICLFPEK